MAAFAQTAAHLAFLRYPDVFLLEALLEKAHDGESHHRGRSDNDCLRVLDVADRNVRDIFCYETDVALIAFRRAIDCENEVELVCPALKVIPEEHVARALESDDYMLVLGIGCASAAQSSLICLSGEGADEFFAGYHIYRRSEELAHTGGPWHYGCAGVMEPEQAASLLKLERPFPTEHLVKQLYADSESDEHLSRLLRIDCALWLEGDILFGINRSSRSCGLKLLLPYADRRLFELSTRIPAALKWKDGVGKYILRRAAEQQLPHEVAFRSKIGFSVPIGNWMRREPFRARFEAVLFGPQSARFFDQSQLRRYWAAFLEGNDVMRQIVYAAYVFLIWAREYGI